MSDLKNVKPLDDFNWDEFENGTSANVSKTDLEKAYDETLNKVTEHQVVEGTVISVDKKEVIVNIGYKSDGIIPASEFRYNPDLKVGDKVEVYVENQEDVKGQLVLSHKKARLSKSWERVNAALENEEVIQGYIKCRTKGGMIVDVFGIEAFLPGSQIDVHPIRDYDVFVGKTMEFKVVKINQEFRNVVVSHKALIEQELEQQANSRVNHNVITLHNGITRNRLDLVFKGEGAECFCNGCVIADKNQVVDNNTLIDHQVGHCTSNELYKYVLDGEARGAFAGRVLVRHGAQKTTSQETNQNLCATKTARMFTQPMLEIYADDVKCAHGSTVGQLNDAALFYMQQRGVSREEAKLLLQFAFINEVIDKMELEPLRDRLHHLVEKRFRGELNKCEGCKLCK